MSTRKIPLPFLLTAFFLLVLGFYAGCKKEDNTLAPYQTDTPSGTVNLAQINVEQGTYSPRVSWIGGYVSAFGVNRGRTAVLDTSLLWLTHEAGNNLHYQLQVGVLPAGAEDLTTSFGGHPVTTLQEDQVYTYWIAKDAVWGIIAANPGKKLVQDSLATTPTRVSNDTLFLSSAMFAKSTSPIDLYIGIKNVYSVGRLGTINVTQTNTGNAPIFTFHITQTGVPDTLVANIGIAGGTGYDVNSIVWEVLAVDTTSGQPVYWTKDVIASPLTAGQSIPETKVFTAFPQGGLERNKTYYAWIANKNWDQRNRSRSAFNYASVTFDTY